MLMFILYFLSFCVHLIAEKTFCFAFFFNQFCFDDLPCQYAVTKVSSDCVGGGVGWGVGWGGGGKGGVINVCERV